MISAAFARNFEHLSQKQLFQLKVLMRQCDARLGSSHFRVWKMGNEFEIGSACSAPICSSTVVLSVPCMIWISKISCRSFGYIVYNDDEYEWCEYITL